MTYTPITDAARNEMRKATEKVVESIKKRVDPKTIDLVITEINK